MRTRAHDFLVNDLQLAPDAPGGAVLVTSSSDGTIKTWRWPTLEPLETVDLAPFAGGKVEAHALWTSSDASRVLVGTWDHALLDLEKRNDRWTGRRTPSEAGAVPGARDEAELDSPPRRPALGWHERRRGPGFPAGSPARPSAGRGTGGVPIKED